MEADWNKLIERYLQNELSEEGREAFEYELNTNPELKMEYDLHLMIMGSAVRSAERLEIAGIGKRFYFRKKLTNAAIISGVVLTAAITTYLVLTYKGRTEPEQTQDIVKSEIVPEVSEPLVMDTTQPEPVVFARNIPWISPSRITPGFVGGVNVVLPVNQTEIPATPKNETTKEEKKAPEEEKYRIITVRASQLSAKSSTREEKPFYLAGNYTWANEFMIMDTPEGLYMFDTTNNCLTVFKSNYRKHASKYGEMVLFGFKNKKYLTEVYQNRIMYKGGNEFPVIVKQKEPNKR